MAELGDHPPDRRHREQEYFLERGTRQHPPLAEHHAMMFGQWWMLPGTTLKEVLLLAVPAIGWMVAELRHTASAPTRLRIALPVSFLRVALVFGERLGGHHFVVLVPLL